MLHSITLQNFKSFGRSQEVKLAPMTVLVGPNNSGKSNLLSVASFVRTMSAEEDPDLASVCHRPAAGGGVLTLSWNGDAGNYFGSAKKSGSRWISAEERFHTKANPTWVPARDRLRLYGRTPEATNPFLGLRLVQMPEGEERDAEFRAVVDQLIKSRDVKLSLEALRADSPFEEAPELGADGSNLASVINYWRGGLPERAARLDDVMHRYVPEIRKVLAVPSVSLGTNGFRMRFEHDDGGKFDALEISDGVLFFTGLVAHVLSAGRGSLILMEEPETSIHPGRLHDLVELFRELVAGEGCQFIIATHSPVLLDEFRDEPEAILLFRRSEEGTTVRPLSEVPSLRDALGKSTPGEMLRDGFFTQPL